MKPRLKTMQQRWNLIPWRLLIISQQRQKSPSDIFISSSLFGGVSSREAAETGRRWASSRRYQRGAPAQPSRPDRWHTWPGRDRAWGQRGHRLFLRPPCHPLPTLESESFWGFGRKCFGDFWGAPVRKHPLGEKVDELNYKLGSGDRIRRRKIEVWSSAADRLC